MSLEDWRQVSPTLLQHTLRHLVAVQWIDVLDPPLPGKSVVDQRNPEAHAVTTFFAEISGVPVLMTAGHILDDLNKRVQMGRRIVKARLADGLNSELRFPPIPFDLNPEQTVITNEWTEGIDFGMIPLRPLYVQNLINAKTFPIVDSMWADASDKFDFYAMVGFPTTAQRIALEYNKAIGEGAFNFHWGAPLLPVFPCDPPAAANNRTATQFFGRVPIGQGTGPFGDVTLDDIDGLSGSPVFGFKRLSETEVEYKLVAIQSSWWKSDRIIAACHAKPWAEWISMAIENIRTDAGVQSE